MKKRLFILFFLVVFFTSLFPMVSSVYAEDTLKDILSKRYIEVKDICTVVKGAIQEGMNTKEVTKTSIGLGHDACVVIKCSIAANGSLEQIIIGALEAGVTADICTRCAVDAGADPQQLAKILETGLGYTPAPGAGLAPIEVGVPSGTTAGGVLSPSTF
jgi:hypothetical protein